MWHHVRNFRANEGREPGDRIQFLRASFARGLRRKGLREKSSKGCVSNFYYGPTAPFFTVSSRQKDRQSLSFPLTLYRADSWLGELSAPISDAGNVCLLVEVRRARVCVYAYVCHEGFGTLGSLSGRRISVIDGTAASLGGDRDRHQRETWMELCFSWCLRGQIRPG